MMSRTRQRKMSDPTTRASDPATMIPDVTRPNAAGGERQSSASGLTFGASIAASVSAQGATAGGDTVTTPASNGLQGSDGASLIASPDAVAILLPVPNVSRLCERCGVEFVARRPWARFCSAYCRRLAWLDRNPEKAAELAERDKARLRAHIIGNDGEWVEGGKVR